VLFIRCPVVANAECVTYHYQENDGEDRGDAWRFVDGMLADASAPCAFEVV
jgi:hypothetical protein